MTSRQISQKIIIPGSCKEFSLAVLNCLNESHNLEQNQDGQCPGDLFISWPSNPAKSGSPGEQERGLWLNFWSSTTLPSVFGPILLCLQWDPQFRILDSGLRHFVSAYHLVEPNQMRKKEGTRDQTFWQGKTIRCSPSHVLWNMRLLPWKLGCRVSKCRLNSSHPTAFAFSPFHPTQAGVQLEPDISDG